MKELKRIEISERQSLLLPLAFRKIFYKDLPDDEVRPHVRLISATNSKVVVSAAYEKPVSKL